MDRWRGKVALVSGASSGIGAACAKALAENGVKVVACARRVDRIEGMRNQNGNIFPYKCDVGNMGEIKSMFEWIEKNSELAKVDICVANAGYAGKGDSLIEGTTDDWKSMLDINVLGLCLCTQLTIKSLIKNDAKDGHIVLINSSCGHWVPKLPAVHFYSASKFAVKSLAEGFRQELITVNAGGKKNIRVSSLSPGAVSSEMHEKTVGPAGVEDVRAGVIEMMTAQDMAEQVIHIISAPTRMTIHDLIARPTLQQW